ncbi:MAG: cell division protein FtsZ [Bacteroidia bacterium]
MKFDLTQDNSAIIKVIGVGGGGSNAVNHMYKQGIKGVDFFVCNTDQQSLDMSPVPTKIVLGASLTKGRGAGSLPEVGRNAAIETIEEIKSILGNNTEMVFITAGLGGGTGTGAAPIIAKAAKELGILTVGIVTIPFGFEGKKRKSQADAGLEALKQNVDTLLVISNDKLREIYGNLKVTEAFGHADDVLSTAAKGIADIITTTLQINTDINDVKTVMKDSGVAIMGSALASGESRALRAVEQALSSPLLNDSDIRGARYVLVNITCGEDEITMDELGEITDYIQEAAGMTAEVIKGYGVDPSLGDKVSVTIIATGFDAKGGVGGKFEKPAERILHILQDETKTKTVETPVVAPVVNTFVPTSKVEEITSYTKDEVKDEVKYPINENKQFAADEPFLFIKKEDVPSETKEEQVSFEFEITNTTSVENTSEDEFTTLAWDEEPYLKSESSVEENENTENTIIAKVQNDEQMKKAQDRVSRLKELNFKLLKTPNGLSELENEPAYKRKNINLESTPHSSESQVSRYTLSEGEDKKIEIKPNNSFLHDNVD